MRLRLFSQAGDNIFPLFCVHQKKTWRRAAAETTKIIRSLVLLMGAIALGTSGVLPLTTPDIYSRDVVARGLDAEGLDIRVEAFTADGVSLGHRDDANSTWTIDDHFELGNLTTTLAYHPKASYYIVGDNETMVVEFWHPYSASIGGGNIAAVHLSIAADYVFSCRKDGGDTVSVKVVNAGWYNVTEDPMDCEDEGGNGCPALVLTETTNMVHRYTNQDAANLDGFMTDWALDQGWVMTDDFIEYYAYDLTIDGKWIGVPLISDIRVLAYNKTTFMTHNITKPFGPKGVDPWEWEDFVTLAENLSQATDKPGWYFRGRFDEEMKLSLMIGRNWGSTLYREKEDDDEEYKCALDDNFVTAMNLTIEVMLKKGWMTYDSANLFNDTEELWEMDNRKCLDTVLSADSLKKDGMLGMAIVSPTDLFNCSDDIAIAHVPGKYGYLGGTGLFIGKNSSAGQQAHAWGLTQLMMQNASSYAKLQQSPPPFEKLLKKQRWEGCEWKSKVTQIHKSVPTQYPQHGTYNFLEIQKENPFRNMWMEMATCSVNASSATQNVVEVVDELLQIECTEDNHELAGCRICEREEYHYNISSCNPATQTHSVIFFASPSEEDGDCYSYGEYEGSVSCDHVEVTSRFGIAIILASCLGGFLALASAMLVIRYRHRPFIKFSQPTFCVFFSLGVAGLCLGNLALVGPNTISSCVSRFAFPGIAFDLAFGALFSKVYRVRWVVANVTSGRGRARNKRKSFLPVVGVVSLALVVDLMILAAWGMCDEYGPFEKSERVRKYTVTMTECAADMSTFAIIFFTLKVALIGWGVYLAWVTRKINYTLVEGREMSWSIYLFAVLTTILVLVSYSNLKVEYWALARAFVFCLSSCTALVMVLVPKLWAAHRGKDVNMSLLTSSTTSACMSRRGLEPTGGGIGIGSLGISGGSGEPLAVICMHCNKLTVPVLVTDAFGMNLAGGTAKRPAEPEGVDAPAPAMAANRSGWAFSAGAAAAAPPAPPAPSLRPLHGMYDASSAYPSADELMCYCPGLVEIASGIATQENLSVESEEGGDRSPTPLADSRSYSASTSLLERGRRVAAPAEMELCRLASKGRLSELPFPVPKNSSRSLSVDVAARSPPSWRGGDGGGIGVGHAGEISSASSRKGSLRSSWRRSFASNFSSGSGYSDLDPASFQRSLMAQAAAIRAALWGPHTSVSQSHTGGGGGNGWSSAGSSKSRRSRGSADAASDAEGLSGKPGGYGGCGKSIGNSGTSEPSSESSSAMVSWGRPPLPRRLGLSPRELGDVDGEKFDELGKVEGMVEELPLEGIRECDVGKQTPRGLVIPAVFGSRNKRQDNLGRANDGSSNSNSVSPASSGRITSEVSITSIGMSSAASESTLYPTEDDSARLLYEDYAIPLTAHHSGSEMALSPRPVSVDSSGRVSTDARGEFVRQPTPPKNRGQDSPAASFQDLAAFSETNYTVEAPGDMTEPSAIPTKLSKSTHPTLPSTLTSEDGKYHEPRRPLSRIPDSSVSFTAGGDALDMEGRSGATPWGSSEQQPEDIPGSMESLRAWRRSKFSSRQNSLAYSSSMDGSGHHAFGDASEGITTPTPIDNWRSDQPEEWTPSTSRSAVSRHSSGRLGGVGGQGQMSRAFSFTVSEISFKTSDVEVTPARSRTRVQPCVDGSGRISVPVSTVGASPQRSVRSRSPGKSGVGAGPKGTPARPYRRNSSSATPAPRWTGSVGYEDATGHGFDPIDVAAEANTGGASRTAEDQAARTGEEASAEVATVPAEVLKGEVRQPADTMFESNDSTPESLAASRLELAKWLEAPSGSSRSWSTSPSEKGHMGDSGNDVI